MADVTTVNSSSGVAFLVAAGIMYEIIAAACSSPQTAEINAAKRSETLMKWVKIGIVQGIFFIVIAAAIDRKKALPILAGGALAGGLMGACYYHANVAGLRNGGEGTEQY